MPHSRQEALALLRWYLDAGVDETVADAPADSYAANALQRQSRPATANGATIADGATIAGGAATGGGAATADSRAASSGPPAAAQQAEEPEPALFKQGQTPAGSNRRSQTAPMTGGAAGDARTAATACQTLEELRGTIAAFEGCALKDTATSLVFADGNPDSGLMFVGEAPGADEDRQGLPFVGRAGQLLDRMLAAIGRDRDSAYISNILPWRPPGNRKPTTQETETCLPFIRRHIELAQPQVLVLLGGTAASTLLDTTAGITRIRGRWMSYDTESGPIDAMPTFHPAYLLRSPALKRQSWRDLLAIRNRLRSV